jgi:molybdopterin-guanine dinucleotide biosynthesis adapter protein
VVIAAPDRIATIRLLNHELTLDEIVVGMTDVDIILVEGYKRTGKPSIEVLRAENSRELICDPAQLIAVVADFPLDLALPQYRLDDGKKIADFIEARFLTN